MSLNFHKVSLIICVCIWERERGRERGGDLKQCLSYILHCVSQVCSYQLKIKRRFILTLILASLYSLFSFCLFPLEACFPSLTSRFFFLIISFHLLSVCFCSNVKDFSETQFFGLQIHTFYVSGVTGAQSDAKLPSSFLVDALCGLSMLRLLFTWWKSSLSEFLNLINVFLSYCYFFLIVTVGVHVTEWNVCGGFLGYNFTEIP